MARRSRGAQRFGQTSAGVGQTLVDAHNLIHAHARLRALMSDPEEARSALALLLRDHQHVRLICDGGPGGQASLAMRHGITIEYSGCREADDVILERVAAVRQRTTVVTDDRELSRRARSLGARIVSCADYLRQAGEPASTTEDPGRGPVSSGEAEAWMRWFGLDAGTGGDAEDPQGR